MAEDLVIDQATDTMTISGDSLAGVWDDNPKPAVKPDATPAASADTPPATPDVTPAPAADAKPDSDVFDADQYLKDQLGWNNWDEAKAAKAELEEFKKQPKVEQAKFTKEESDKLFEDAYVVLQSKKQLERIEKLDPSKAKDAAEIVKAELLYKNKGKGLDGSDIDFLFEERYSYPDKPKQSDTQTDEEYAQSVKKWEDQVARIEKRLTVEAKMAQPELSKIKSELVVPDIPKPTPQAPVPNQEELAAQAKIRDEYLATLDTGIKAFTGFNVTVKDEAVELPISYSVTDEERVSIKKDLESFDPIEWLNSRWLTKDGKVNTALVASDKYLLENQAKVLQKMVNEAASKRFEAAIKTKSNINVSGQTPVIQMPEANKTDLQKQIDHLWANA